MKKNENGNLEETIKGITYEVKQYPNRTIEYVVISKNENKAIFSGNESETLCFFENLRKGDYGKENFDFNRKLDDLDNMKKKDVDDVEYAIVLALVERTTENEFPDAISEYTVKNMISKLKNEYYHGFESLDETLQSRADNMVDNYIAEEQEKKKEDQEQEINIAE